MTFLLKGTLSDAAGTPLKGKFYVYPAHLPARSDAVLIGEGYDGDLDETGLISKDLVSIGVGMPWVLRIPDKENSSYRFADPGEGGTLDILSLVVSGGLVLAPSEFAQLSSEITTAFDALSQRIDDIPPSVSTPPLEDPALLQQLQGRIAVQPGVAGSGFTFGPDGRFSLAEITAYSYDTVMELRDTGTPTFYGAGFPALDETVNNAADIGNRYYDYDRTAGAFEWTMDENYEWQVTKGDTGWVYPFELGTPENDSYYTQGGLMVRRINNVVYTSIGGSGASPPTIKEDSSPFPRQLYSFSNTLPDGFKPSSTVSGALLDADYTRIGSVVFIWYNEAYTIPELLLTRFPQMLSTYENQPMGIEFNPFPTSDPWPAVLPSFT